MSQLTQVKVALLKRQHNEHGKPTCPICEDPITVVTSVVDHNHTTGFIRDALCRNCNGLEGKIKNVAGRGKRGRTKEQWLVSIIKYWRKHEQPVYQLLYPLHKTEDEKRVKRNLITRKKRAAKKVSK